MTLRRTTAGRYAAPATAACGWARGARLTGGGTPTLRTGGHASRLTRPYRTVPRAFTGHWRGRIRPSRLIVDLTMGTGPGVWRSPGFACTGTMTVWQYDDGRLVLVNARHGLCRGRPDTLVLTENNAGRLAYRQVSGIDGATQRGTLRPVR